MKIKYEIPGQRCNAGHLNGLPIKLWDCPICTELLNECIQELQRENKMYRNQINIYYEYFPRFKRTLLCISGRERMCLKSIREQINIGLRGWCPRR